MSTLTMLSWAAFLSSVLLFIVKCWHWYDTYQDWRAVQRRAKDPRHSLQEWSPLYRQAKGSMIMGWLRVIDGFFWLALGAMLVMYEGPILTFSEVHRTVSRGMLLAMIWMEAAKVLNDRFTRVQVMEGIIREERIEADIERARRRQLEDTQTQVVEGKEREADLRNDIKDVKQQLKDERND